MPPVSIRNKLINVGTIEIPLIGGEVHYWRLDPANWCDVLTPVREMGIQVVATYVCWDYHEISPGVYDFSGETHPRRNLLGFLDLLTQEDFWIIFRPGPYIYSEWKNGGVPDDAARYHRLDERFQRRARDYMSAVTEIAAPYLATRGGRIILWQADNEIDPWPHWYTEQLGLGMQPGTFQEYLRGRYDRIETLNSSWTANYASFEQVRAVTAPFPDEPIKQRRYLDFIDFQHWYVNKVADWGVKTYQDLGVDVPVYLNVYSGVGTQSWSQMETIADLVGPDIYPTNEFCHWPNEHRNFLDSTRYAAAISKLPYIAEFEAGAWHDWLGDVGMLSSNHYFMACISALSGGVAGWNWYMLVNRDNWYQSPINEWGRTRPDIYEAFKKIVALFTQVKPYSWEKLSHTALTYDPLQRASVRPAQLLLQAMYEADLDYTFIDSVRGDCDKEILFYAGGHWLARDKQEKLKDYVHQGGHLVFLGAYPYLDENFQPYNSLGIPVPDGIIKGLPKIDLELSLGIKCSSEWIFTYRETPGTPFYAKRLPPNSMTAEENHLQWNLQNEATYRIGYTQCLGQGKITLLGLNPSKEVVLALHRYFNIKIPTHALTPGIQTACFQRDQELYLTVVNASNDDQLAVIEMDPDLIPAGEVQIEDMLTRKTIRMSDHIEVFVPRKNATLISLRRNQA